MDGSGTGCRYSYLCHAEYRHKCGWHECYSCRHKFYRCDRRDLWRYCGNFIRGRELNFDHLYDTSACGWCCYRCRNQGSWQRHACYGIHLYLMRNNMADLLDIAPSTSAEVIKINGGMRLI